MAKTKAYYQAHGRSYYENGVMIVAFASACGWQRKAFQDGYKAAREAWKKDHPKADEWAAMSKKNRAFSMKVLKGN